MAGVFREVTMTWKGVDYTFTPSMKLLRRIEGQGDLSLTQIAVGAISQAPKMSYIAFIAAEFLKEGGAKVTEDEVYAALMGSGDGNALNVLDALMAAISPADDEKKGAAPS